MKKKKISIVNLIVGISLFVFAVSLAALLAGEWLTATVEEIGIRIAMLVVTFAAFVSSTVFGLLIFMHNRTVNKANNDANTRAELFRELTFASTNYSIIEFMDRMLIYNESQRYIDKYISKQSFDFHMIESKVSEEDVLVHPEEYRFISIKIPFRVVEGKVVSAITFDKLKFKRDTVSFEFGVPKASKHGHTYILYNEQTKRNNVIINLVVPKNSDFWISSQINVFSKITINIEITSLLGVRVAGIAELYFTNPEQIEGDGTNTYKINSTNFSLTEMPTVTELYRQSGN